MSSRSASYQQMNEILIMTTCRSHIFGSRRSTKGSIKHAWSIIFINDKNCSHHFNIKEFYLIMKYAKKYAKENISNKTKKDFKLEEQACKDLRN